MKQKKKNGKLSWNWAAFFFAPYWFFYRKLYKVGAVFLALSVALSLATISQTEKVYGVYEKMVSVQQEINELVKGKDDLSGEDSQKFDKLYAEAQKLTKAAIPTLAIILLIQKVIPNTIAALIANYSRKKCSGLSVLHTIHRLSRTLLSIQLCATAAFQLLCR